MRDAQSRKKRGGSRKTAVVESKKATANKVVATHPVDYSTR